MCELLVRGPQTPGELRTRASRMAPITDGAQAESILEGLRTREDGPFVARLAREPGRRDSRYAQLFSGPVEDVPYTAPPAAPSAGAGTSAGAPVGSAPSAPSTVARLDRLEEEVRQLRQEVTELKQRGS